MKIDKTDRTTPWKRFINWIDDIFFLILCSFDGELAEEAKEEDEKAAWCAVFGSSCADEETTRDDLIECCTCLHLKRLGDGDGIGCLYCVELGEEIEESNEMNCEGHEWEAWHPPKRKERG